MGVIGRDEMKKGRGLYCWHDWLSDQPLPRFGPVWVYCPDIPVLGYSSLVNPPIHSIHRPLQLLLPPREKDTPSGLAGGSPAA
jgi:hypothetical protein